jgi:hypothetical protein
MSKVKEKELWQAVKEVLWREWDPIGISSSSAWDDEYNSYVNTIVRLLQAGADEYKMTEHLDNLRRVNMGLSSANEERDCHIARRLINLVR